MCVSVQILDGPLTAPSVPDPPPGTGALTSFEGIVRPLEDGHPIIALDYQVYEPMACRMLLQIAREILQRHGLLGVWVQHSRGRVGVGQCSFRLHIAASHRHASLAATAEFIDHMKRDVPIWKNPVFADPSTVTR